ncbi:thiamine diphosphokinase, partial [Microgenomates group bacterium]|nr:thiamine diphosphokinase [Microgenomates group bacterium]
MKRAIIFSNGELADISRLRLKKSDLLIGVDGGAKRLGKPDLIIGDLDSIKAIPKDIPVLKLIDQDKTDTQKALEYVVELGY